ncbi:MAG: lytic transglycosylase domain-containing protein [Thermoanaerobaculia bacterium]
MTRRLTFAETISARVARARRAAERSRFLRVLGGRGAITLVLGCALSVGGVTEAFEGVHFLVEKDLDAVRVVRQKGDRSTVVAKLEDGFAANSVFKLSQAFPDKFVTRHLSLFSDAWIPVTPEKTDVLHEEFVRIGDAIRRQFFSEEIPYGDLIHEKAEKYNVDPALVAAVIEQESKFHRTARSQVGARGLMQLMPRTGRWMGATDLYDPEQNIDAGVKYIKYLQGRFGGNLNKTIAAYNAGEGNVRRYGGVPPFGETQTYVKRVMRNYAKRNEQLKQYGKDQQGGAVAADVEGVVTLR